MNRKTSLFLQKWMIIQFVLTILFCLPIVASASPAPLGIRTVCIDAGHGGHDPGCLGKHSKEKDIALAIALKLGNLIETNYPEVKVVYTRKTDKFIELHERASIANNNNADLFISIHCNGGSTTALGTETYVMGLHRSKENLAVAKRENASVLMESDYKNKYDGFDPNSDEGNIIFTLFQSAYLEQSLSFAAKVQDQFRDVVLRNDRGVKQAGFLVLYRTAMPAVLIETGFLTNKEEEEFLKDTESQKKIATAIFNAFSAYKKEVDGRTGGIPEGGTGKVNSSQPNKDTGKVVPETAENASTPAVNTSAPEIVFRVQLASSSSRIAVKPENFKGLTGIIEYKSGNVYRYTCGEEKTLDGATRLQEQVRGKGYTDAFVVAFKNGERISVAEALKELNK